jgi:diguanylate cyclase
MKLGIKLPLVIIPLIAGPLLAVGILAYIELKNSAEEKSHRQVIELVHQLKHHIESTETITKANAKLFASDTLVKNYLLANDEDERYSLMQLPLQKKLISIQQSYPSYYEIRIILADGFEDLRVSSKDQENLTEDESSSPLFNSIHTFANDRYAGIHINPDNNEPALYVSQRIKLIDSGDSFIRPHPLITLPKRYYP